MRAGLQRVLDLAVALVTIILNLILQAFCFLLLAVVIEAICLKARIDLGDAGGAVAAWVELAALLLLLNGLTCYIYFKWRRPCAGRRLARVVRPGQDDAAAPPQSPPTAGGK